MAKGKRGRKRASGTPSAGKLGEKYRIAGKAPIGFTVANGNNSVGVQLKPANLSTLLTNLGKAFRFYRFRRLKFVFDPVIRYETTTPADGSSASWAFAYIPEGTSASLTTTTPPVLREIPDVVSGMAQVVNSNVSNNSSLSSGYPGVLLCAGDTCERSLTVRTSALADGTQRKYFTQGTDGITTDQGILLFSVADSAGANTVKLFGVAHYEIEFSEPLDSATLGLRGISRVSEIGDSTECKSVGESEEADFYILKKKSGVPASLRV